MKLTQMIEKFAKQGMLNGAARASCCRRQRKLSRKWQNCRRH